MAPSPLADSIAAETGPVMAGCCHAVNQLSGTVPYLRANAKGSDRFVILSPMRYDGIDRQICQKQIKHRRREKSSKMFLPTTRDEMDRLGWHQCDIILVTGDAYIDSPFIGAALIGRVLADRGYKTGIIGQPDIHSSKDIARLGEPALFWGVTGGCVDSMVANYTALKKRRKLDDYTPGGINDQRPDRAVIAYTNLIRRYFKPTVPIVLGGIEASLRRIAHYDFWSGKIRRSILLDAKADYLLFGMAHDSILDFARALADKSPVEALRGLVYISNTPAGKMLPAFEAVLKDKKAYSDSFHIFYQNNDPLTAQKLCQPHNNRFLIINPPAEYSSTEVLDHIHGLGFERDLHPYHKARGEVRALDTIRFAIPTHYGCYGECHFCAISVHQGRTVRFRSPDAIVREAADIARLKGFKGYITDLGGPTANMYGFECKRKLAAGACQDRRCLYPVTCRHLKPDHTHHISLIRKVEKVPGVKKVFISSGIRYDMILDDHKNGTAYLKQLVSSNISGQMKIAPEHVDPALLRHMGKPSSQRLVAFKKLFDQLNREAGKKQFLTYYLIAAHPGCSMNEMALLKTFAREKLNIAPEQVQIFTPSPSTYSSLMYYTEKDPFSNASLFVEKDPGKKQAQKDRVTRKPHIGNKKKGRKKQK